MGITVVPREIEDKKLMQNFGGKQSVSWEMCNWRMEIQNRKKARGGRWEEVDFFPFPFPSSPTRFLFFPHPILPSTTTQRGGSNRTLGAKDFSSAISVTFTFFTPKHPAICEKKPLVPSPEGYRMANTN